ncbi:DeoR/GlpR family DNA-binding transcription regulator [Nonomuraea longicatena]
MLQHLRHEEIMRRVRQSGATSVADLARLLGVSPSTIRRDLEVLDRDGTLRRVRGGALASFDADDDRPFSEVAAVDEQDKDAVAARAAELVRDGDVVLLDIGTTTVCLARRLRGREVTVVTSSLAVLDVLRSDPVVELLLLGGRLRKQYHSLVGVLTEESLRQVVADRVFLGGSGVRPDGQLVDTTLAEVPLKRAMIASARQVVLLVDHHKFPGSGALRVCGPEDIDVIVTNRGADAETLANCSAAGAEVVFA